MQEQNELHPKPPRSNRKLRQELQLVETMRFTAYYKLLEVTAELVPENIEMIELIPTGVFFANERQKLNGVVHCLAVELSDLFGDLMLIQAEQ